MAYAYPYPFCTQSVQEEDDDDQEVVEERRCSQGHRASLQINTSGGGCICLLCFCNLITQSSPLFTHKAYATSQLSQAFNDDFFLHNLLPNHRHFLVSPLSHAICHCTDQILAKDLTHLLLTLSTVGNSQHHDDDDALLQDIILHLLLHLTNSANSLVWATNIQTTVNALHCLGLLMEIHCNNSNALPNAMRNQKSFLSNLVFGLRLPSDELRGEILFVLYKLSNLEDGVEELVSYCPRIIHLALKALTDTESDELRTNCVALLIMFARASVFDISLEIFEKEDDIELTDNVEVQTTPSRDGHFARTFAEAIKGALLSSDVQLQISTVQLIYYACPTEIGVGVNKNLHMLIEEGTTDYLFEILRLSENTEALVVWCVRVLNLLSAAEETFTQRLSVGFSTICRLIGHVAEIPLHPAQTDTLLLISAAISNCPGIVSTAQAEELLLILGKMLNRHSGGAIGLSSDAFNAACSTLVALFKTPSCRGITCLAQSIHEALNNAISSSSDGQNLLYSLNLLKEAYIFTLKQNNNDRAPSEVELAKKLIQTCENHLVPSVARISEQEQTFRELLQVFYFILQDTSLFPTAKFAEKLAISSWFSFSFECLARFPSNDVKHEVFLIFSLLIDRLVGDGVGESVREASLNLPSDPLDSLFLLGQKSSGPELLSNQCAIISILHATYLYGDRLADDDQVLASLEHYILVNASNFSCGLVNSSTLIQILHIYAFVRETQVLNYHGSTYSIEAEKLLLRVMTVETECDLLSARIPKVVLRWLFQHDEDIQEFLRVQILNLCRFVYKTLEKGFEEETESSELGALDNRNNGCLFLHEHMTALAELIEQEDCGTAVVVCLLDQMVQTHAEDDLRAVFHILMKILDVFPEASNRFHAHGIAGALYRFYRSKVSPVTFTSCTLLVFNVLYFAKPEAVIEDNFWLGITNRMLEMLVARLRDKNSAHREVVLLFSIVALILQRSVSQQGLPTEAAKAVLLNTQLGSAVEGIIEKACERGPRVAQIDEQAGGGEILLSALVFHLFWLRSFPAVLQESIDWHDFLFMDCYDVQNNQPLALDLHTSDRYGSLPINIQCHQLCRLLYFGSPLMKLVASYSLVEMFSHIADWKKTDENHSVKRELKCSPVYLQSVVMVLQGFILQVDNICTAKNAATCVYWLLVCNHLNSKQQKAIEGSKWYRLILEELVLCLATPNSVYYSFKSGENPSAYIGIALLRMCPPPEWVRSVLSGACIRSIVENLSSYKPTPEIVVIFRELLRGGYIEQEQIAKLQHLFQTVRRCVYMDKPRGDRIPNNHTKQRTHSAVDCNEITTRMVELAMCVRVDPITGARTHTSEDEEEANRDLIAEIDEFLRESATYA